jgi:hypothetical protein
MAERERQGGRRGEGWREREKEILFVASHSLSRYGKGEYVTADKNFGLFTVTKKSICPSSSSSFSLFMKPISLFFSFHIGEFIFPRIPAF